MDRLTALKLTLIERAAERHGAAPRPCHARTINDCFVIEGDTLYFWYNGPDLGRGRSTHIEKEKIV
jgi:hypothetical protein